MAGRVIGVTGPSGVGKDSVMRGLAQARPDLCLVRRVITRPAEGIGEDYEAVSNAEFFRRVAADEFCLHWQAHGLYYGIPAAVRESAAREQVMLVNLSRQILNEAQACFPGLCILNITAKPERLAVRLRGRGREDEAQIIRRLARDPGVFPEGLTVLQISNDGTLDEAVRQALRMLRDAGLL